MKGGKRKGPTNKDETQGLEFRVYIRLKIID
jgi:hypothetical protein